MKARSRGRLGTMLAALGALAMVVGAGAAGAATSTPAGASAWWRTEEGSARLVAATGAVGEAEALRLGLEFRLAPGWKVYWRSAGAAGYPPRLDWSGSINLAAATPAWPAPTRFSILGLDTLGYEGAVVLPITARPAVPGRAVRLHARLDYLTCKDICIPYRTELALALPAGEAFPTPFAPLIARYQARVPGPATADGLAIEGVRVRGRDGARLLEVAVRARAPLTAPDLFVEGPPAFEFGAPTARLDPDGRGARLRLPVGVFGEAPPALAGSRLRLTLVDGDRALETAVTVAPGAPVETAGTYPLLSILGLALLGGLILNLMPCVLPVLSIKLLGAVELGGRDRAQVRRGFLASAAGILFAFGILASAAIAVKLGGGTLGWGIQFQEPLFLVAMGAVLVLFAANLWGLFEIRLPGTIADRAAGPVPAGRLAGPFFTGVLATVLATPCSAPFLGTAVGFALVRGPGEIVAVFAALGIGLAAPYLAVAAVPGAAALLPRPGPWMGTLRRLLALALVGTAVWLMTVLAAQQGLGAALVVAGLLAALGAVVWLGRELAARGRAGAAAVLVALALGVPALWPAVGTAPAGSATLWRPFAPGAIAGHVSAGRTVFVNVTADWCLTCRVNEAVALDTGPVTARLGGPEVVAMRADWTRADPAIAGYLESFGRYGIPFDAVYGPALPEGMALPELLTEALVIGGLDAARGAEGTRAVAGTGGAN